MKVSLVPFDHIDRVWDVVRPMLEPAVAVSNGRYTTYDLYVALQQQRLHLWIAFGDEIVGCEVTQVFDYPSKRVLISLFTAGRMFRKWREPLLDILTRWARDNGCSCIEGMGREQWVRLLEPYGVRRMSVNFEMEV